MKKVILLVLDDQDVAALPNTARFLRLSRPEGLFVLHNPQLGLNPDAEAQQIIAKIERLERDADAAAARRDTTAFADFVAQIGDFRTQRDLRLTRGFKEVPADIRSDAYAKMLEPLRGIVTGEMVAYPLPEPFDPADYVQALHSVKHNGYHPKWITWGARDYSILHPRSLPESPISVARNEPTAASESAKNSITDVEKAPTDRSGREEQLRNLKHYGFISACRRHGIPYTKGDKTDAIRQILDKEFSVEQAA